MQLVIVQTAGERVVASPAEEEVLTDPPGDGEISLVVRLVGLTVAVAPEEVVPPPP